MLELRHLQEYDPTKKNVDWINAMVTRYRMTWQPIVDAKAAARGLEYLYGQQSMENVKKMFTKPDDTGLRFYPLAVLEKARNILLTEVIEGGIQVHLEATDPTAFNEKQRDRDLLSNRKIIEAIISKEQQSIGGPAYSIADDKDENGQPRFNGNVQQFDEMGLDEDSSEDVGYFFAFFHRLNSEIKAEEPINTYFSNSEVRENIEQMVDDILSKKAVSYRTYVSDISGAIEHKYIDPVKVRAIRGHRKSYKDAACLGFEEEATVQEFLRMVGDEFNPETDMEYLLQSVNANGGISNTFRSYTGVVVTESGCESLACGEWGTVIRYDDMLNLKVKFGYIEFKSNDAVASKRTKKGASNHHGNVSVKSIALDKEVSPHSTYEKEVRFYEKVYEAYYLSTSTWTQKLYKAGPRNWQMIEGADDEIAGYSTSVFVQTGPTFIDSIIPMVEMFQKAFYKMEYEINRAKPAGRAYFYDSLVAIAENMLDKVPGRTRYQGIMQVIKMFAESPNEIYTVPNLEGAPVGGGAVSSHPLVNGLSPTVMQFKDVMEMADAMIDRMIGFSPQRSVYAPKPREVGGLQDSVTSYSDKATGYIQRMLNACFVQMGNTTLRHVQNILAYGKGTKAYKHLLATLGDQNINDLKMLGKVAIHRYSIFVEWFNLATARQKVEMLTMQAQANKEITAAQALLIDSISSPKKAAQILAFEKDRTARQLAKITQAANNFSLQLEDRKQANAIALQKLKNDGEVMARDTQGRWLMESYRQNGQTDLTDRAMKIDGETAKIREKTKAELEKLDAENNLNQQQPAGATV